jgi:aminoglycoside phosphotransferase (APT) family kinase protein
MATCIEKSKSLLDAGELRRRWDHFRDLPPNPAPDVMNHSDLIPGNVLVSPDLRLAGVLDVGDLKPADPALDLVGAWHLLDAEPRAVLRASLTPATSSGNAGRRGRSSRRWVRSGTTSTATRR